MSLTDDGPDPPEQDTNVTDDPPSKINDITVTEEYPKVTPSSHPRVRFDLEDAALLPSGVQPEPSNEPQHETIDTGPRSDANPDTLLPLNEIRLLQRRLWDLEARAVQQWGPDSEDGALHGLSGKLPADPGYDPKGLRTRPREFPSARRWVERVERQANETAGEREDYGQGPEKSHWFHRNEGMFHVKPDGTLFEGTEAEVRLHDERCDGLWNENWDEIWERKNHKYCPLKGIRPPTALRPIDNTGSPEASGKFRGMASTSKLGPPTEWDISDSEDWGSDTSLRSQDFSYFRSRLRGDFEWELDRLNAQVQRFRKHKQKKALALEKEEDAITEGQLGPKSNRNVGILKLNPVNWAQFKMALAGPKEMASVIDVLTEEPKVESDPWLHVRRPKSSKIGRGNVNHTPGDSASAIGADDREDGIGKAESQSQLWTGQGPLPERIRINSRSIIESLSSIHGSEIFDGEYPGSMVILRPFRILYAYDREIREMSSKLVEDMEAVNMNSTAQTADTTQVILQDTMDVKEELSETDQSTANAVPSNLDAQTADSTAEMIVKKEHLLCLRNFMDEYLGKKVEYLKNSSSGKILFSDLWFLFQPGTTVISADGKQAFRVASFNSKRHKGADFWSQWDAFRIRKRRGRDVSPASSSSSASGNPEEETDNQAISIKCVYIHFDGYNIGPATQNFGFNKWDGEKDATDLDICPLRFHVFKSLKERSATAGTESKKQQHDLESGLQSLKQKLIERGRLFIKVSGVKQMYYSGLAVKTRDEIESQVMVDFEAALSHKSRKLRVPRIERLGTDDRRGGEECMAECCQHEAVLDDSYVEENNNRDFINNLLEKPEHTARDLPTAIVIPRPLDDTKTEGSNFTDDELMIMSYSVFGFVLRDRTWGKGIFFRPSSIPCILLMQRHARANELFPRCSGARSGPPLRCRWGGHSKGVRR